MTTQTSTQISLFHQIAAFFAGPDTVRQPSENAHYTAPRTAVEIIPPLMPPTRLLGDDTEDDEPADLALIDLIPLGLAALNLPHYQATQALDAQMGPTCLTNACQLEDRPLTEAEMETTELEELIPTELKKLNIARAKAVIAMKERRVTPTPLPDLAKLPRDNSIVQSTNIQNAA